MTIDTCRNTLRRMWQFPSIVHCCAVFKSVFSTPSFTPSELENALLYPNSTALLQQLHFQLCSQLHTTKSSKRKKVDWESILRNVINFYGGEIWEKKDNPLSAVNSYHTIDIEDKVMILYSLCIWVVDELADTKQLTQSAEDCRALPLGVDADGNKYYSFSNDCWLFKQSPQPSIKKIINTSKSMNNEPECQVVCTNLSEMRCLSDKLRESNNVEQTRLCDILEKRVVSLQNSEAARIRAEEKRRRIALAPRRQSSRQAQMASKAQIIIDRQKQEQARKHVAEQNCVQVEVSREQRARIRHEKLYENKRQHDEDIAAESNRVAKRSRELSRRALNKSLEDTKESEVDIEPLLSEYPRNMTNTSSQHTNTNSDNVIAMVTPDNDVTSTHEDSPCDESCSMMEEDNDTSSSGSGSSINQTTEDIDAAPSSVSPTHTTSFAMQQSSHQPLISSTDSLSGHRISSYNLTSTAHTIIATRATSSHSVPAEHTHDDNDDCVDDVLSSASFHHNVTSTSDIPMVSADSTAVSIASVAPESTVSQQSSAEQALDDVWNSTIVNPQSCSNPSTDSSVTTQDSLPSKRSRTSSSAQQDTEQSQYGAQTMDTPTTDPPMARSAPASPQSPSYSVPSLSVQQCSYPDASSSSSSAAAASSSLSSSTSVVPASAVPPPPPTPSSSSSSSSSSLSHEVNEDEISALTTSSSTSNGN